MGLKGLCWTPGSFFLLCGFEPISGTHLWQPYPLLVGYWGDPASPAHLDVSWGIFTMAPSALAQEKYLLDVGEGGPPPGITALSTVPGTEQGHGQSLAVTMRLMSALQLRLPSPSPQPSPKLLLDWLHFSTFGGGGVFKLSAPLFAKNVLDSWAFAAPGPRCGCLSLCFIPWGTAISSPPPSGQLGKSRAPWRRLAMDTCVDQ